MIGLQSSLEKEDKPEDVNVQFKIPSFSERDSSMFVPKAKNSSKNNLEKVLMDNIDGMNEDDLNLFPVDDVDKEERRSTRRP